MGDRSEDDNRRLWLYCLPVEFMLANVALFLHPMSPEDFLDLAFSDPLFTVTDANGGGMAALFWISIALMLISLLRIIGYTRVFHRILPPATPVIDVPAH